MRIFVPVLLLTLFLAAGARGQEVLSTLTGIVVDGQTIPFDAEIEMVADCIEVEPSWPLPSPIATAILSVKQIEEHDLRPDTLVSVYAFGDTSRAWLTKEHRYQVTGKVRDAFSFGGKTSLHLEITSLQSLGKVPQPPPAAKAIDPTERTGESAELSGTLWSLNGVWWFNCAGEEWYLTNEKGRSMTFATEWHGIQVKVKGEVDRQLRASLDQISLKSARDLKMYSVILGALVEPANQDGGPDTGRRFGVLYSRTPKMVDGVFDLIPERSFRRNIIGNETDAGLYAERNGRWLEEIWRTAGPETLDVMAARMNDPEKAFALQLIYAGILAANNDERGRVYLVEQTLKQAKPSADAMFVLGAFPHWAEDVDSVDVKWTNEAIAHCLQTAPTDAIRGSAIVRLWLRANSAAAQEALISLIENPPPALKIQSPFLGRDTSSSLLYALLDERATTISTEHLIRLAEAFPEPEGDRRRIAERLLQRDEPVAAELFLPDLEEDFWYLSFRENVGPKVLAAIRKRLPDLPDSARKEAELLLCRAEKDPVAKLIERLEAPATPLADFNKLRWELESFEDPRSAVPLARFLKNRIFASPDPEGVTTHAVTSAIEGIGAFDTPEAVAAMIDLFDADYSGVTGEYLSADEIRSHIGGQLTEMTGVSFGTDAAAWRNYFEKTFGRYDLDRK